MTEISVGGVPVETVFDLLGRKENDITYALGWGLSQSDDLLCRFVERAAPGQANLEGVILDLQRHPKDDDRFGITDVEIVSPRLHLIVEAKRGWNLPLRQQLELYLPALQASRASGKDARFIVLTQWGERLYVERQLGSDLDGIPIVTVGLGEIAELARASAQSERRGRYRLLMQELAIYLRGVAHMRNVHDNRVYVVALSDKLSEAGISYIDVVRKLGIYWYPADKNYPKTPYNYMGFRYGGRLQSIHRVRESVVVSDLSEAVPQVASPSFGPAFVLTLDVSIPIPAGIRTGKKLVLGARRTIDIDLLLTSPTISEASDRMKERHA